MPEVTIIGPDGRLEGRYHQNADRDTSPIALVLHPHPQHGGTMNNKVVYNVYHCFARLGFSVLRFNFRGVGRSQGSYDDGLGELSDAASALDWMQSYHPNAPSCWIGGFSFGAWISMQLLMRRPEIDGFITIAPPANVYDFAFLAPCPSSGLVVQGAADDIVPEEEASKLVGRLQSQKAITIDYQTIGGANHFFDDHITELNKVVDSYLGKAVKKKTKKKIAGR
jgi:hypothetical protein